MRRQLRPLPTDINDGGFFPEQNDKMTENGCDQNRNVFGGRGVWWREVGEGGAAAVSKHTTVILVDLTASHKTVFRQAIYHSKTRAHANQNQAVDGPVRTKY